MSLEGICIWDGHYDPLGLPHGHGTMTLLNSKTLLPLCIQTRRMDHGVTTHEEDLLVTSGQDDSEDEVTYDFAQVDDDFLYSLDDDEQGDELAVAIPLDAACGPSSITAMPATCALTPAVATAPPDVPAKPVASAAAQPPATKRKRESSAKAPKEKKDKKVRLQDKLTYNDIEKFFHLPIKEAAQNVGCW